MRFSMPSPLKTAAALALTVSLMGCATQPSTALNPEAVIPTALTTCQDAPAVPGRPAPGKPRSDDVISQYIADLKAAFDDCKSTVAAVAQRRADLDKEAGVKPAAPPSKGLIHFHIPFTKITL